MYTENTQEKNTNAPKLIARLSINLYDIDDEKERLIIECNDSMYSITRLTKALINNSKKNASDHHSCNNGYYSKSL